MCYKMTDLCMYDLLISVPTECPRSSDPFYTVTFYVNWATTSWTDGSN